MAFNITTFQKIFINLNKDDARKKASFLANKFTQDHPLIIDNYEDASYLRHLFIYLNVDDISKYISHLNSFNTPDKLDFYLTENHLWPSTCRILYSNYNPGLVNSILEINIESIYSSKLNSKIVAGIYAYLFKSEKAMTLNFSIEHSDSLFLNLQLFNSWESVDLDSKIKIWSVISGTKNTEILNKTASAFGWSKEWLIGSEFMIEELLSSSQKERNAAILKLVKSEKEIIYSGIDLNL